MRLPKNLFGTYTKPKIFLCETDKQKIGVLNTTDTHVSLKFNSYSELSFNIDRTYIDTLTGNKQTHLFYDRIEHPRLILLENIGYFQIQAPDMSSDGFREFKTITAYSSEYALSQKYITNLHVNTGEVDSVEVIYAEEIGNEDTIEPVIFYNEANPRLSLLHLALEGIYGWKIGHIDDSLKTLARSFDIDRQSIYDFLMNDVCEKFNCYIIFDTLKNEINIYAEAMSAKFIGDGRTKTFTVSPPFYKIETVSIDGYKTTQWEYNKKTGALTFKSAPTNGTNIEVVDGGLTEWETDVFVTYENLAKEMNVSYNADDIKTQLTVTYGDDLDIREINMGLPYITDLSYFYTVEWMGQELYDAYTEYLKTIQTSQTQYTKNSQEMLKISDQQYYEEQRLSMEYSVATVDSNTIGTYYVKEYANDSYFYREVTLPDDYKAYTTYYKFDGVNLSSKKVNDLYMAIRDNFMNKSVEKINELIDAFKFMEDSYYDIEYLAKYLAGNRTPQQKKTYVMNFLKEMWNQVGRTPLKSVYQATFKVLQSTNIDWAQEHIDPDGNVTYHKNYPWYYAILLFLESIDIAIADRDAKIDKMQQAYDELQAENIKISNDLLMEQNFTESQLIRLSAFIKEDEIHIDDIIETEYETLEDSFKVKQDAMEAGRIELSKRCQPQLQFSMTMANIYALPEFEPIIHQFQLGKVIKVGLRRETKTVELIGDGVKKNFVLIPPLYEVKTVSIDGVEQSNWTYNKQTGILTPNKYSTPKKGANIEVVGSNNYIKQSRLLQVDMGLDDLSDFQVQFGELTALRSQSDIHADLLAQAIQAGKSVASSQNNWNSAVDMAISTDIKIQQGLLDATTTLKSMDGDQGVEVDKYGIHLRKVNPDTGKVDPKQGWITNNMMAYTDNNWASAKSVFGEYTIKGESSPRWGMLSDAVISGYLEGSTIVGGKLNIGERKDKSYNFSVNYEGHMIAQSADVVGKITANSGAIRGDLEISGALRHTNGNYTVQLRGVQEDSTDSVFHIAEKSGYTTKYPFRVNGDGSMSATRGDIGGWSITDSKIYSGDKSTKVSVMQKSTSRSTIVFATGGESHDDYSDCPFRVTSAGNLYASKGEIGGWSITDSKIYSGTSTTKTCVMQKPETKDTIVFAAGGTSHSSYSSSPFYVTADGRLHSTSGDIGGFNITSSYIAKSKKSYNDANDGVYIGTTGIGLGQGVFYAKSDGSVVANNITTNGIKATGGTIGGWTLSTEDIAGYSNTTIDNSQYRALIRKSSIGTSSIANVPSVVFGIGKKEDEKWTWPFYVDGVGNLYTNNATVTGTLQTGIGDAVIKGKIVATSGEIGGCKITNGTLKIASANIDSINADVITAGTIKADRIEGLPASKITSGTFSTSRIPNLSADKITSGTLTINDKFDMKTSGGAYLESTNNGIRIYCGSRDPYFIVNSSTIYNYAGGTYFYMTTGTDGGGNSAVLYSPSGIRLSSTRGYLGGTWSSNSAISTTSDENKKNTIAAISNSYEKFFDNIGCYTFKYDDGTSDRLHCGFISQRIKNSLDAAGISTQDFGGVVTKYNDDGTEDWYIRYAEFVPLNTWQIQKLKTRVSTLENKIELLKQKIEGAV